MSSFVPILPDVLQSIMAEGHAAGQIILQLHDVIVPSDAYNDQQKSAICERLAVSSANWR